MNELCLCKNLTKKGVKFKLAVLKKTMQIEVEIKPLITDVMNRQGWWRVSPTLPFPGKLQRVTRDYEMSPSVTKALSSLWAAFLQQHSQPLPVRVLLVGTKRLWSRQPTHWPPTMALVPSVPSFPAPPTRAVIPLLPHQSDTIAFQLTETRSSAPLQSLHCLTLSPLYLLSFSFSLLFSSYKNVL